VRFESWAGSTRVFDGTRLRPGDTVSGPGIVDWPTTGVLVHPGQRAAIDRFGHLHLEREP
jgi:N-methylhydantoinase A/oxoprolinase/acetone carboxylase beta subunit